MTTKPETTKPETTKPETTENQAANATMGQRTYEERHAAALDVLGTLSGPGVDAERVTRSMQRRHGALGSFAMDFVLGDLWCRPQLSRRDRSLVVLSFLATLGSEEELRAHVRGGLNHGLSRAEIDEVILQVAAYAGFPTALPGARIVDEVFRAIDGVDRLPERPPAASLDDAERRANAADVLQTMTGGRTNAHPAAARRAIVDQLGGVGELAFDWAFGQVWCRTELSRRDRSLVVVAILGMLARPDELRFHARAALRHGCTQEEVEEVMVQLVVYGGFPRAVEGMRTVRAALAPH